MVVVGIVRNGAQSDAMTLSIFERAARGLHGPAKARAHIFGLLRRGGAGRGALGWRALGLRNSPIIQASQKAKNELAHIDLLLSLV